MTRGIVVDPVSDEQLRAQSQQRPAQSNDDPTATDDDLPEKFKGKSVKDVISMYTNLESETGRLRNELGQSRSEAQTWRTLVDDISTVRRQEQEPARKPVEISGDQLIAKPRESVNALLDEALQGHLAPIVEETQKLRRAAEISDFERDFPDYVQVGNDPEFQSWLGKSKRRLSVAERALKKSDIGAMRELMEGWEERRALIAELKPSKPDGEEHEHLELTQQAPTGVDGARKVATEKSGNSGSVKGKKVFYQNEVIDTLLRNPDKYYSAPYQKELLEAMQDGRYKK